MKVTNERLKLLVEELDLIPKERLDAAYRFAEQNNKSLGEVLVASDLISDDHLGQVVAGQLGFDFVDLDRQPIDPEVLNLIPRVMAKNQKVIAFERDRDTIKLAMVNPSDLRAINLVEKKTGQRVIPYYTTWQNIENTLPKYQKGLKKEFADIIQENISQATGGAKAEDVPIIKIVDTILQYAYENKASDIHIEPMEEKTLVRFRIDGILHDIIDLPKSFHELVVTRIKIMSQLRTDEHRSAQDGKIRMKFEAENLDIRVSIIPVVEGEKVVLRLLSEKSRQLSLEDLGFSNEDLVKLKKEYAKPYGAILATGPTGSGKTTTLYAVLKNLNRREVNIATIEDPVEYDIEGVNQVQVNPKTNLTFAQGLRSLLRQDPDIIMVGEIRDQETADIAINSAMTGHLVLSTLHTNDAATALPRFLKMGIEPFLIASTVNIIIAQRLVRRICSNCIVSEKVTTEQLAQHFSRELIDKHFGTENKEFRIYRGKGCELCGQTGYRGRVAICEILVMSEAIRDLIMKRANADQIKQQAITEGMKTMIDDGIKKVLSGLTTIEEVLRATRE
ncbi:MAG: type II/IV secretion system protein [Candidatus Buchananbacteria bacterium]|nr:type II/IV secretion system protein [Candidatus Buchananbacteria bacterium]